MNTATLVALVFISAALFAAYFAVRAGRDAVARLVRARDERKLEQSGTLGAPLASERLSRIGAGGVARRVSPVAAASESEITSEPDDTPVAEDISAAAIESPRARAQCRVRLVPQIPIRDAGAPRSWIGGSPRLPAAIDWPVIDGDRAQFIAQIACADLPQDLWGGCGPRTGWLAFFVHPQSRQACLLHAADARPVRGDAPPFDPALGFADLGDIASLAIPTRPEWPVDPVAVRPGDPDPGEGAGTPPMDRFDSAGFDIADPALHPFDWPTMLAMVDILDRRIAQRWPDAASDAGANHEAKARAQEIIAIVRETAETGEALDAPTVAAVIGALAAIRWVPDASPADASDTDGATRSLTVHDPAAPLWAHDYAAIHFDHARHAWCRDPAVLSDAARAHYEPLWRELAAQSLASIGSFDADNGEILLDMPSSRLLGLRFGDGGHLVLTIGQSDLADGRWDRLSVDIRD